MVGRKKGNGKEVKKEGKLVMITKEDIDEDEYTPFEGEEDNDFPQTDPSANNSINTLLDEKKLEFQLESERAQQATLDLIHQLQSTTITRKSTSNNSKKTNGIYLLFSMHLNSISLYFN